MNNLNDKRFDAKMRRFLQAELDPQLGRASACFQERIKAPAPAAVHRRRLDGWLWGVAGAAIAASITLVGLRGLAQPPAMNSSTGAEPTAQPVSMGPTGSSDGANVSGPLRFERVIQSRQVDDGTVTIDHHRPFRRIRNQRVERTRWYDPEHDAQMEMIVPREDITLVGMRLY